MLPNPELPPLPRGGGETRTPKRTRLDAGLGVGASVEKENCAGGAAGAQGGAVAAGAGVPALASRGVAGGSGASASGWGLSGGSGDVNVRDCDRPESHLLLRGSPFGNETGTLPNGEFEPGPALAASLRGKRVLVLGAGGLGCELLKGLALSGVQDVHVIDADTIDLTNLNRQFLFRERDIGRPKAVVAAEFINQRVRSCKVTPHQCYIQTKPPEWFRQFSVVIGGLDNIVARRWMNATLCALVSVDDEGDVDDPATVIPFIDGGTEGFGGQIGVMIPRVTACFECTIDLFPPPVTFAMCTIAETPRKAEHCVAYVMMKSWEIEFPDRKLDADSPEDMQWVYERASERARAYGIEGVTHALTLGVVKNIIPAIASTNALVASLCVLEAFKLLTYASQTLDNYFMYRGAEGVHCATYRNARNPSCSACAPSPSVRLTFARSDTLGDLIARLKALPSLQLPSPTLGVPGTLLFTPKPQGSLAARVAGNLVTPLPALGLCEGSEITVTDSELGPLTLTVHVHYMP